MLVIKIVCSKRANRKQVKSDQILLSLDSMDTVTKTHPRMMSPLYQSFGKQTSMPIEFVRSRWRQIFRRHFIEPYAKTTSYNGKIQVIILLCGCILYSVRLACSIVLEEERERKRKK